MPTAITLDAPHKASIVDPIGLQTLRDGAAEFEAFARSRLRSSSNAEKAPPLAPA